MLVRLGGYTCFYLSVYLYFYVSSSPCDFVSTLIARPLYDCLVKKINQGTDVFTHKHTELPTSSFSIVPCSVCGLKHVCMRLTILTSSYITFFSHYTLMFIQGNHLAHEMVLLGPLCYNKIYLIILTKSLQHLRIKGDE